MKLKELRKRDFIMIATTAILIILLVLKITQTQKLKEEIGLVNSEVESAKRKIDSLDLNLSNQKLLIEIDNLILESLANENSIEIDSLRAMYVELPLDLFNDVIAFRLDKEYSIGEKISAKNKKIQNSHAQVKMLVSEYSSLKSTYDKLQLLINELENKNHSKEMLTQKLISQIDSLNKTNLENLNVIEFKKNGNTVYYIGAKANGKPNGYGVGLWSTGGIYKGEWKYGLRDGFGIYVWKDGEVYEGEWKDGMRTGKGKYIWKDKQTYVGGWLENKRHGFGSIYYPNGKLEYEGQWDNDKFKQPVKSNGGENGDS